MYTVTSQHLSADGLTAGPFEPVNHGDLSAAQVIEFLTAFAQVTGETRTAEITIAAFGNSCTIRILAGKLVMRSNRDGHTRDLYFSPEDIVDHLDRAITWTPFEPSVIKRGLPPPEPPPPGSPAPYLAGLAFALGLGILFYALHAASLGATVNTTPVVEATNEPISEQAAHLRLAVGTFATGRSPGDRVIAVGEDHTVSFYEIGPKGPVNRFTDTYLLERHDGQDCLATTQNGVIDLTSPDSVTYYRDLYLRSP